MSGYIPLENAKDSVISALNDFDPELGRRAAEILTDDLRANIHEVPRGTARMMACRPAGITLEDLENMDMYRPEQEHIERFGQHFASQNNDEDYAIIDYEYDGTTHSAIYLAHEVGHAIADDIQREMGFSFKDFITDNLEPTAQLERQAYFVQSIFQHYLHENGSRHGIDDYKNPEQSELQTSWARAVQLKAGSNIFQKALALDPSERSQAVVAAFTETTDDNGAFINEEAVDAAVSAAHRPLFLGQ